MTEAQVKGMSLEQLKALAYDQLRLLEQSKVNLRIIDNIIAEKEVATQTVVEPPEAPIDSLIEEPKNTKE